MGIWLIYALMSAFTAALVAIFGKLGLKEVDSTLATTLRSIVMTTFLIVVTTVLKKFTGVTQTSTKDIALIILSGIAGAVSWLFYFAALKTGLVSQVVPIDRLSFVFAIIMGALILGEPITYISLAGMILMAAGALLMIR